jgi:hypothetical protein
VVEKNRWKCRELLMDIDMSCYIANQIPLCVKYDNWKTTLMCNGEYPQMKLPINKFMSSVEK